MKASCERMVTIQCQREDVTGKASAFPDRPGGPSALASYASEPSISPFSLWLLAGRGVTVQHVFCSVDNTGLEMAHIT